MKFFTNCLLSSVILLNTTTLLAEVGNRLEESERNLPSNITANCELLTANCDNSAGSLNCYLISQQANITTNYQLPRANCKNLDQDLSSYLMMDPTELKTLEKGIENLKSELRSPGQTISSFQTPSRTVGATSAIHSSVENSSSSAGALGTRRVETIKATLTDDATTLGDEEIAEEESFSTDSSDEDDVNEQVRGMIRDSIETTETCKVAISVQKRAKQAENKFKKQSSDLVSECDDWRSITSSMARSTIGIRKNLYTVKKIQLGTWVKKGVKNSAIDALKEELELAKRQAEETQNKLLQISAAQAFNPEIEVAETAWRNAERDAIYAMTVSNTAESEKYFTEAVRLSKNVEKAWDKAFDAKNALLEKTSEINQPSLHNKIEEARIQKRYWAAKVLWNEAVKEEYSAAASLQQITKPNNPEEVNLWHNRVIIRDGRRTSITVVIPAFLLVVLNAEPNVSTCRADQGSMLTGQGILISMAILSNS